MGGGAGRKKEREGRWGRERILVLYYCYEEVSIPVLLCANSPTIAPMSFPLAFTSAMKRLVYSNTLRQFP